MSQEITVDINLNSEQVKLALKQYILDKFGADTRVDDLQLRTMIERADRPGEMDTSKFLGAKARVTLKQTIEPQVEV